jgi:hypothetical protein
MQKDHLPKLELDGFETPGQKTKPAGGLSGKTSSAAGWRERASRIAEKAGVKIVWEKPKPDDDVDIGYKRLLVKTGICAAIAIAILIISAVAAPAGQPYTGAAEDALSQEFDIDDDIGRLKFVQNLDDEVESVMSVLPGGVAVYPSDGDVITAFGEGGAKGVRFSSEGATAYSIAKATVTAVGEIDGQGYLKLTLDTGETALYCNIEPLVLVDDIVMPGQAVGELTGDYLYVEMKDGEEYIDPIGYIGAQDAQVK